MKPGAQLFSPQHLNSSTPQLQLYGFVGDAVGFGFQRFASEPSGAFATTELPLVCWGAAAAGACSTGGGAACLTLGGGVLLAGHDGMKSYGSYPK
jgi:hypothetical protein